MLSTILVVGTQTGVRLIVRRESTWEVAAEYLTDAWITSIADVPGSPDACFVTTRDGRIAKLDLVSCQEIFDFGFRLWFLDMTPDGRLYAGGTPPQLLVSDNGGSSWTPTTAIAAMTSHWHSHSGGAAHLNSMFDGRAFGQDVFLAAEVGGVLRSNDPSRSWTDITYNLDPDVHSIDIPPWSPTTLYAATGTGLYQLHERDPKWDFVGPSELRYLQAVTHHPTRPLLYISGARTPYGRHSAGAFAGTSADNTFAVFAYNVPDRAWAELSIPGTRLAGILSKALTVDGRHPYAVYVGTVDGVVACIDGDDQPSVLARGLGLIECVHILDIDENASGPT